MHVLFDQQHIAFCENSKQGSRENQPMMGCQTFKKFYAAILIGCFSCVITKDGKFKLKTVSQNRIPYSVLFVAKSKFLRGS